MSKSIKPYVQASGSATLQFEVEQKMTNKEPCAECGGLEGVIQHADIAWPGGRHWEGWLHPECEKAYAERLEAERPLRRMAR